jgi:hypothetical protein
LVCWRVGLLDVSWFVLAKKCGSDLTYLCTQPVLFCFANNHRALALTAYEDTYLTILDVDGSEWADDLRAKMQPNQAGPLPTEQTWLMDHIMV